MKQLLEESKQLLLKPLGNARRKLLVILNIVYVILVPVFLISEKIATGNFVNDSVLYLVYGTAVLFNLISAIYNFRVFKNPNSNNSNVSLRRQKRLDLLFGYASIIPILFMSFCNMIGLGNPSNDSILTDFALAQSLMIVTVMIIGRIAVTVWFIIVVAILFWNVSSRGWDYQYHYLTPTEALQYKEGLKKNDARALTRKAELEKAKLNPPKVTRYFNIWIVFTIVAFLVAYFFSGITVDILKIVPSVVNNIEQALESSKRIEADRKANEEKTRLFINLAHETKTPLTILNNYADEYIKKHGTNKEIEIIKWNLQRLTSDIVNFFDIERFNKGFNYNHNQITDASIILSNKLPLYRSLAQRKKITIEDFIKDDCFVLAHPGAVERIMNNLIENSVKFTSENGTIRISLFPQNNEVHFLVDDTGIGIPSHLHSKIFEPYFQLGANRNNEGMGMGLAIVKKIIDDLGGTITIKSELNRGTKITVVLPLKSSHQNEVPANLEASENLIVHAPVILFNEDCLTDPDLPYVLLVEDNVQMLSYLAENLRNKYNIYVAKNGVEAWKKLHSAAIVDLIVSDVMMDAKDGFDFCKEVSSSKRYGHIPFIFLTAKSTAKDKLQGLKLGAVDYIEKPFMIDQLAEKIESILNNLEKQRIEFVKKVHRSMPTDSSFLSVSNNEKDEGSNFSFEANCRKFNLTTREMEIANLIIKGQPYKAIGDALNISNKTVAKHVENIFTKVGVNNKVELINKLQ